MGKHMKQRQHDAEERISPEDLKMRRLSCSSMIILLPRLTQGLKMIANSETLCRMSSDKHFC
jgi:hypothetical protein